MTKPVDDGAEIRIDIPASVNLVTVVRMIVASAASAAGSLDGDRLDDLRWVTSEATTNAIQANMARFDDEASGPYGRVTMRCEVADEHVALEVADQGLGFATAPEVPEMTHPDRLLIEGGFGVPLMQHLTRGEMNFTSSADGTKLRLRVDRD